MIRIGCEKQATLRRRIDTRQRFLARGEVKAQCFLGINTQFPKLVHVARDVLGQQIADLSILRLCFCRNYSEHIQLPEFERFTQT